MIVAKSIDRVAIGQVRRHILPTLPRAVARRENRLKKRHSWLLHHARVAQV
jgi:hypothetical protein